MQKIKKHRRIKRRFVILYVVAVLTVLAALIYMDAVGNHYTAHTYCYFDSAEEIVSLEPVYQCEGVVSLTDYDISDDGELLLDFDSAGKGETEVSFRLMTKDGSRIDHLKTTFRVTAAGTIIEDRSGIVNFSGYNMVSYLFLGLMALVMLVMLFSFFGCYRKSEYSYPMIAYGGIAIYIAVLLLIVTYKMFNNVLTSFTALVQLVTMTGEWFVSLMFPAMLVLAIAVSISNIWLLRHEGFRPVNALGIAVSAVWLIALAITLNVGLFRIRLFPESVLFSTIRYTLTYVVCYFECMLISTSVCAFIASRHTPPYDRDYIIILGCAIRRDGSLTPLLRGRVDSALRFEQRQYEAVGKHACFVPSGGQGPDEVASEGEAMERYLIDQGVAPERIIREDKSVNTFENMQLSRKVIEAHTDDFDEKKIAFSTTNYHVFRGYILSDKNGFKAQGISAKTKWYFFPNAFLREFIGLLFDQKLRHILIIVCIVLAAIGIERII